MDDAVITAVDYRGEVVTGKRWMRANRITITNPYLGQPFIAFDEEELSDVDGAMSARPHATLSGAIDLATVIDLIDPSTGLPLGATMTEQQIYVALYSVYRSLAAARDAQEAAAAAAAATRAAQLAGTA